MTPAEAKAWLDGFAAGAVFFAASWESREQHPHAFEAIRAQFKAMQTTEKGKSHFEQIALQMLRQTFEAGRQSEYDYTRDPVNQPENIR